MSVEEIVILEPAPWDDEPTRPGGLTWIDLVMTASEATKMEAVRVMTAEGFKTLAEAVAAVVQRRSGSGS